VTTYENGRLPDSVLTETSGGKILERGAAASYERTSAAFKAVFGKILAFNSGWTGYRTYDQQVKLYNDLGAKWAAWPGTSNHGFGLSIDADLQPYASREWKWMNTEGRKYGWRPYTENDLSYEPWHWTYNEDLDTKKPTPKPPVEDDMPEIKNLSTANVQPIKKAGEWQTVYFTDEHGTTIAVDPDVFSADIKIRVAGVDPGAVVQARVYRGDWNATTQKFTRRSTADLVERIGTSGDTFVDLYQSGGKQAPIGTKNSNRIRVEIYVPTEGAKIVKAAAKTLTW
jgi:hypothetical protein